MKHSILQEPHQNYSKDRGQREQLETIDYSTTTQKNSVIIDSNLSDNSLGVEVDSHFDRMMSYSSDSQMDQIQQQDESDSNPNALTDSDVNAVGSIIGKEEFLLDGEVIEPRDG